MVMLSIKDLLPLIMLMSAYLQVKYKICEFSAIYFFKKIGHFFDLSVYFREKSVV